MYIRRSFNGQFSLRNRVGGGAFLCFIVMLCGCGGEETVNSPVSDSVGDGTREEISPISTPYYPMAVGSRWVYRNPDGSEWTREVAEIDFVNRHDFLLFFSHDPPLEDNEEANPLVFVKAPSYLVKSDQIVRPISLKDLQNKIGKTVTIPYKISKTVHGIFNGMEVHTRYRFIGSRTYEIHGLERSDFRLLASPLVPGATWKALDIRFNAVHNKSPQSFSHSFDAHLEIWAKIGANRTSIVTPAGAFEDCLEIHYYQTRFQIETTELKISVDGFGQAAEFPKVWKEIRKYVEAEIPKTAATEVRKSMPQVQLGSFWLAPGVGPVRLKSAEGTTVLIDYEVKAVANGQ